MDYPQLNLLFGLGLILSVAINIGLRVLLSKARLPVGLSLLSWIALIVSILSALYIEILFLRFMTPAFNWQIGLGVLMIGGIGTLITASLYRRELSGRATNLLFIAQIFASLIGLVISFALYRSLVPAY
jgi:hypothetical protein